MEADADLHHCYHVSPPPLTVRTLYAEGGQIKGGGGQFVNLSNWIRPGEKLRYVSGRNGKSCLCSTDPFEMEEGAKNYRTVCTLSQFLIFIQF